MQTIQQLKDQTTAPVIVIDHEGIVLHINESFENTWGWRKENLVGQTLTTILPANLKDAHHMGFSRFLVTGKPMILDQALKLMILKADGQEIVAEHFIVAEQIDGNWMFGATITPLPET